MYNKGSYQVVLLCCLTWIFTVSTCPKEIFLFVQPVTCFHQGLQTCCFLLRHKKLIFVFIAQKHTLWDHISIRSLRWYNLSFCKEKRKNIFLGVFSLLELCKWLASMAQLDAPSDWKPGGSAGSTPAEVGNILLWRLIVKYFLRSFSPFRWFKKGSCPFLAKECAQYWLTA